MPSNQDSTWIQYCSFDKDNQGSKNTSDLFSAYTKDRWVEIGADLADGEMKAGGIQELDFRWMLWDRDKENTR